MGTGKRFQILPKKLKQYKIATLRYLKTDIMIDDNKLGIRITIKKKIGANWFWTHNIDENKKVPNYSTHPKDGI